MRIDVVTVFPAYLAPLQLSLIGRAIEDGVIDLHVHDLRDFTDDRHRTVDDTPYGGGPGMVMTPEPWARALDEIQSVDTSRRPTVVVPTPSGRRFAQPEAQDLAHREWLVFACGRYEGIDARVMAYSAQAFPTIELSIGDYVLAGGEAATLVMVEAIGRLLPGVLGNADSVGDDSFSPGRAGAALEGPVFTKPREWRGMSVPDVLLSGDHQRIAAWRAEQSRARTAQIRPDLD